VNDLRHDDREAFATVAAEVAFAGHQLRRHVTARDDVIYVVSLQNWSRNFTDLASVEDWLRTKVRRERNEAIHADNRAQDRRDEADDLRRGPGGSAERTA
jgi:hypothetical protein